MPIPLNKQGGSPCLFTKRNSVVRLWMTFCVPSWTECCSRAFPTLLNVRQWVSLSQLLAAPVEKTQKQYCTTVLKSQMSRVHNHIINMGWSERWVFTVQLMRKYSCEGHLSFTSVKRLKQRKPCSKLPLDALQHNIKCFVPCSCWLLAAVAQLE